MLDLDGDGVERTGWVVYYLLAEGTGESWRRSQAGRSTGTTFMRKWNGDRRMSTLPENIMGNGRGSSSVLPLR